MIALFALITVFQEFVKCTNKDIEQIIKKETSGDVKNAFYAIGDFKFDYIWSFKVDFADIISSVTPL